MKKLLIIDRDGTIVMEPPVDFQLDSFEKLEYYSGVFSSLSKIAYELDYDLIMVTNQDGLGTDSFPEGRPVAAAFSVPEFRAGADRS